MSKCDNCQKDINTGERFYTNPPIDFNRQFDPDIMLAGLDVRQGLNKILCENCAIKAGKIVNAEIGEITEKSGNFEKRTVKPFKLLCPKCNTELKVAHSEKMSETTRYAAFDDVEKYNAMNDPKCIMCPKCGYKYDK